MWSKIISSKYSNNYKTLQIMRSNLWREWCSALDKLQGTSHHVWQLQLHNRTDLYKKLKQQLFLNVLKILVYRHQIANWWKGNKRTKEVIRILEDHDALLMLVLNCEHVFPIHGCLNHIFPFLKNSLCFIFDFDYPIFFQFKFFQFLSVSHVNMTEIWKYGVFVRYHQTCIPTSCRSHSPNCTNDSKMLHNLGCHVNNCRTIS